MNKPNDEWIFYKYINYMVSLRQIHVDTRDFHCSLLYETSEKLPDLTKILKLKDRFFHTDEEIKNLLERCYTESGGKREWRFFCLEGMGNWFKYIRILKTENGWLVCDRHAGDKYTALNKETLSNKVKQGEDY